MKLTNIIKNLFGRKQDSEPEVYEYKEFIKKYVSRKVSENKEYLQKILKGGEDIIYREFSIGEKKQQLLLVYVDGMVDKTLLNEQILKSLMVDLRRSTYGEIVSIESVKNRCLSVSEIKEVETFDKLVLGLLSGDTLVFMDGEPHGLVIGSKGWDSRGVAEPTTEKNVKGPKDCFVETLRSNTVLIRRRIRDPNLAIEMLEVGRRTKTDVALVYLKGVIKEGLAEEVKQKIKKVDIDGIIDSGQLEQLIAAKKWTIFPQTVSTERPDKIVAGILEGRFAIIVDGSPFVLLAPAGFADYLDAPDDYYENPMVTSILRITRYLSFFLSASLPGIYIAMVNLHPGMFPPKLVISIVATRGALPFPTYIEMFIMESVLEVMQEAGIRLPQSIGQTVSIVGGIVIGQAAVEAGLVSPIVVIIVSLTAITSFTLPSYGLNLACRALRLPFMVAGATLGFFGIIAFSIMVLTHMASLDSFGVGYFEGFSPYRIGSLKDAIVQAPLSLMRSRPEFLKPQDTQRQKSVKSSKEDGNE
ncbi:spore germination protein [Anaerosolibacter sp.]|uniref:spore germination protein n=1 Tax=Anaerosolibacter sp. TaxID=1872527 RepID=UPI0039EEFB27